MDGKSLAKEMADLDWTAKEIGMRQLSEFVSVNPEMARAFLEGESVSTSEIPLPEVQQFSAEDGLKSVRMLVREIQAWVPGTKDTSGVLTDLRECERILDGANKQGVRWHFLCRGVDNAEKPQKDRGGMRVHRLFLGIIKSLLEKPRAAKTVARIGAGARWVRLEA